MGNCRKVILSMSCNGYRYSDFFQKNNVREKFFCNADANADNDFQDNNFYDILYKPDSKISKWLLKCLSKTITIMQHKSYKK